MAKKISIDPITRLEGHGKIEIFLDDDGNPLLEPSPQEESQPDEATQPSG